MKVTFLVKKRVKRHDTNSKATIYIRVRDGRKLDLITSTKLSINPNLWDEKSEQIKSKVFCSDEIRNKINGEVRRLKTYIEKEYQLISNETVSKEWLKTTIDKYYSPYKYDDNLQESVHNTKLTFEQLWDEFLLKHKLSEVRKRNFQVLKRTLLCYELYIRTTRRGQKTFSLDIDTITSDTLHDIGDFFENEHQYYTLYPTMYGQMFQKRIPKPRGRNTLIDSFCKMRTFFFWCYDNKKTKNRPFDKFKIDECTYGTPVYITLEERDKLYAKDLSEDKLIETQRDIFIFQSLIGCRISDLYRMTKQNVINGAIEYIPRKTKEGNPVTVRVPLNDKAKAILVKYSDYEDKKLLPFIYEKKYNDSIRKAFELTGIDRIVTILDPLTSEEVKKPLYEVASSHMARRTFIGNIYKKVKDPNLIGALSGHKEGSKAFNRYREIDEEMKKELVNLLD